MPISEVRNIDCMDAMSAFPDKFIDLAIVDPPYGIGEDGRNNHTRGVLARAKDYRTNGRYDNEIPTEEYFKELFRISSNQIIWGGNYFAHLLPASSCWIVWDKNNGENDFADCELAWTSFPTAVRKFKHTWHGMLQENMKDKEERIHPNQKPIRLYHWILKKFAKDQDIIFDSHMGSQSLRIAAADLRFDFYGCEKDPQYFEAGNKRFKEQTAQIKIF